MHRIILPIILAAFTMTSQAGTQARNFFSFVESALQTYASTATQAVLIHDLSAQMLSEDRDGGIKPDQWTKLSDEDFKRLIAPLMKGPLRWEESNVSALAAKGSSMIVFADKNGEALFGLMHENRWKKAQFLPSIVSGNISSSVSFDGVLSISLIDRKWPSLRDSRHVITYKDE